MLSDNSQWRGYTLDEIRVKRVINATKIELDEGRLKHLTDQFMSKGKITKSSPILSKVFGALDYFDYGILVYRIGRRVMSLFRHKRR